MNQPFVSVFTIPIALGPNIVTKLFDGGISLDVSHFPQQTKGAGGVMARFSLKNGV